MACFKVLSLILWALLGAVAENSATAPLPISMISSSVCSYEAASVSNGSGTSTLPGIVCPYFLSVNSSYGDGPGSNYMGYGSGLGPLVTLMSTSTEVSTINPSAVVGPTPLLETITATSTISKWHTATETHGNFNTTISYIEIISYSILSVYTTTFLVPPTPIVYTVKHALTSTVSANDTYQLATGLNPRLSSSHTQGAVKASSHRAGDNSTSLTGTFMKSNSSIPTGLVSIASAGLSDLPVWTDTLGAGGGNGNGNGTTSTLTLTSSSNTTVSGVVITLTSTVMGTGAVSSGEIFTTDATSPRANATYIKPSLSLSGTIGSGGSGGAATQTPTTEPQHKNCGIAACLDYTVAALAALMVIVA